MASVSYFTEIKEQLSLAAPVVLTFFTRKSVDMVAVVFVGHLGRRYLAIAGIASVTANVTGNSMVVGFGGAVSTLCSWAKGADDYNELGNILQRSFLILPVLICIPVTFLWLHSAPIMAALGQDKAIALPASHYLMALIPNLWGLAWSYCIQNFLHSQGLVSVIANITLIVAVLNPCWCYFFIYYMDYGFIGAAISVSISRVTEFILLALYITCWSDVLKTVNFKWSTQCFQKWIPFLQLAVPNLLMMSEWWSSEILTFLAGSLTNPEVDLSVMSVYQSMVAICFMFPSSFRVSSNTRVGNALGANRPKDARTGALVAMLLALVFGMIISCFLLAFRSDIGVLFTNDAQVVDLVGSLVPILCIYVIADGAATSLTGVIQGMGKQPIAFPVVMFSYYIIGIPLAIYLARTGKWGFLPGAWGQLKGLGVEGLVIGGAAGTWVHFICFIVVSFGFTNWARESLNAQRKIRGGDSQSDDLGEYSSVSTSSSTSSFPSSQLAVPSDEEYLSSVMNRRPFYKICVGIDDNAEDDIEDDGEWEFGLNKVIQPYQANIIPVRTPTWSEWVMDGLNSVGISTSKAQQRVAEYEMAKSCTADGFIMPASRSACRSVKNPVLGTGDSRSNLLYGLEEDDDDRTIIFQD